jgi:ATP-dependent DNA helicase RecQ
VRDGLTVVISPLIALMEDQVAALQRRGVAAALLNSTLPRDEAARIERAVLCGTLKLLYLSPERLLTSRTLQLLSAARLALFAIDEAHCIAEWGHDFRPHYLGLTVLAERFPAVPRLALTATADAQTQDELVRRLGLGEARRFRASFDRPNITIRVVPKRARVERQLLRYIEHRHRGACGVVYCQSRARVAAIAAYLDAHGVPALPYHAGMSPSERALAQRWFIERPGVVMVATIAFGMGIDKADVRFVAHVDVPVSLEGYYQEIGRAGRDGLPAEAWLAYAPRDGIVARHRLTRATGDPARRRVRLAKLDAMLGLCETAACRRVVLLRYFGEARGACGACDRCAAPPWTRDGAPVVREVAAAWGEAGAVELDRLVQRVTARDPRRGAWRGWWRAVRDGMPRDEEGWRAMLRQCVALGLLTVEHTDDGVMVRRTDGERPAEYGRRVRMPVALSLRSGRSRPRRQRTAPPRVDAALWCCTMRRCGRSPCADRQRAWRCGGCREWAPRGRHSTGVLYSKC